jgi:hypothetical protein
LTIKIVPCRAVATRDLLFIYKRILLMICPS